MVGLEGVILLVEVLTFIYELIWCVDLIVIGESDELLIQLLRGMHFCIERAKTSRMFA